ncbi:MAG: LysM peptidoglycan-binding domain-containing protein [Porphyromonadaceae bacterium]|nr:LysM peptidoglycan-binding domain-containing protein [Porphyromonadaceae bacterium]
MKSKIISFLLVAVFSIASFSAAQQTNYPTKIINGIEYYIYTVEAGEGLYSISRKFGVSQSEINIANPQIHEGLKAGQEIFIPKTTDVVATTSAQAVEAVEFITHTVERRQTLFAISRKYDVSQELIIQANPQLRERGIQAGDVLRIPTNKKTVASATPKPAVSATPTVSTERTLHIGADGNYITHNVTQGETLYSISRKYSVTVNELKQLNPETTDGLRAGTVLKVPFKSGSSDSSATAVTTAAQVTPATTTAAPSPRQESKIKSSYKIAYLLPFMTNDKNDPTAQKFIEFYMGSLLAINNVKSGDVKFEIYSFDTEKTESKLFEVINKPEMQDMDLIIGPAYTAQIPILADFAKRRQINTVIPFSSKVSYLDNNPYLFQFNPDQETQNDYIVELLKGNFRNSNFIFVETGNVRWTDEGMNFFGYLKQRLDKQRIGYNSVQSAALNSGWSAHLSLDKKNIIIFDTDDYKSIQPLLTNLADENNRYDVGVLGQYSWRNQNGKKPKMYYVSPFAGNKLGTLFYEQEFQKYYKNKLPLINPRYDLLGYDLTTYFLSLINKNGFTFNNSTQNLNFNNGVQSNMNFRRTSRNGGFLNHKLYLIEDAATTR